MTTNETNPVPGQTAPAASLSEVTWESPSNLAIVKYWGKHGQQLPRNASISMTLSEALTRTRLRWREGTGKLARFTVEGTESPAFAERVEKYLRSMRGELPWLERFDFEIETANTFPHSSGIASSASGMSALALCLGSVAASIGVLPEDGPAYRRVVSHWARLGSGSAARSVCGPWMVWGKTEAFADTHHEHAMYVEGHDPLFDTMRDAILIVSAGKKAVSSTAGHALMESHPHAAQRFANAERRMGELAQIMRSGDVDGFLAIAEAEALELHALMMTSSPPYLLMTPDTLAILHAVRRFREETGTSVGFSLDAGPNVHLLYPESAESAVHTFIEEELRSRCVDGRVLFDRAGTGPRKLG